MDRFLRSLRSVDGGAVSMISMLRSWFFEASTYAERDDSIRTRIEDYLGICRDHGPQIPPQIRQLLDTKSSCSDILQLFTIKTWCITTLARFLRR